MPEDSRGKQPSQKYLEVDEKEKGPNYEQKKWEEEQMGSAMMRFGAKDAKTKLKTKVEELVFFFTPTLHRLSGLTYFCLFRILGI